MARASNTPSPKAIVAIAVSVIVAATERDIQHRSASEIRGSKFLWRLASLNAVGALAYRRWGRRPTVSVA
jgi:hypothetical protein